ncbi:hypothetical protein GCM10011506_32840 [Marivirga lumbricoides]|uniref:Outer membrane protein beta-barrel domain-containing protein n=3 Tax=Marivirga lumbricoides TaxID=1046115 RepID=A0ABQ1MQH6_9BACT|nr:hypothetical protein GCM10011506_32840 [Marivirga lumbricoides]
MQTQVLGQVFNPWGPPPNSADIQPNLFRRVLSHFSAEVAIGYGNTRYRQNLDDYSLYSTNGNLYILGSDSAYNLSVGIGNWLNKPFVTDTLNTSNAVFYDANSNEGAPGSSYLIESGEKRLRGGGHAVPVHVKLHFNYLRYRLGAGATFELNTTAKMSLKGFPDYINSYESDFNSFFTQKYYITAGVRYWDWWNFSYYADIEFGKFKLPESTFPSSTVSENSYWNFGFPVEKNLSKYFHLVMRPSIDLKSINTQIPTGETIKTNMWNVQFQVGIRVSFPLYRNCPIKNCEAQKEHIHVDKKFRGQPIHKIQNPKVGENHPYLATEKRGLFGFLKRK